MTETFSLPASHHNAPTCPQCGEREGTKATTCIVCRESPWRPCAAMHGNMQCERVVHSDPPHFATEWWDHDSYETHYF